MATLPYFVLGPNTVLSLLGLLHGPDKTVATPVEDWRDAEVDVVIPTLNEEETIVQCLASVLRQTLKPRRIVLVDDASTDGTVGRARAFCLQQGVQLAVFQRRKPIGKTPTIKREANELDCDVEFILDGDTVLESDTYIERTVQELYKGAGIASACGTILPLRQRDRRANDSQPAVRRFMKTAGSLYARRRESAWQTFSRAVTNLYREVLYLFLQRFIYHGQMVFFGTITNPVGCAVAYRRRYVKELFDYVTPRLGDDLTNSEDIFIGFALLDQGYRNIQLTDVIARTVEPPVSRLPRQVYLWSSSFLQSCYYFDPLVRSPFKALKRWRLRAADRPAKPPRGPALELETMGFARQSPPPRVGRHVGAAFGPRGVFMAAGGMAVLDGPYSQAPYPANDTSGDRRVASEPYRQAFGRERTRKLGRPVGWVLFAGLVEKVSFPTVMLVMLILGNWHGLWLTMLIETTVSLVVLALVTKGHRLEYLFKGLAAAPVRYVLLASELVTIGRFASDLWLTNNRKWRK